MSEQTRELRELDAWIGEHVMGMKAISKDGPKPTSGTEDDYFVREWIDVSHSLPHFTTSDADALAVLRKCVQKVPLSVEICHDGTNWFIERRDCDMADSVLADTLPLAICRFAKALYSK